MIHLPQLHFESRRERLLLVAIIVGIAFIYEMFVHYPLQKQQNRLQSSLMQMEHNYQDMLDQMVRIQQEQAQSLAPGGVLPSAASLAQRFNIASDRVQETARGLSIQSDSATMLNILNALPPSIAFQAHRQNDHLWSLELWNL